MRDPETGNSRGFGFISYDSFEASDAAIEVIPCFHILQTFEKPLFSVVRDLHKIQIVGCVLGHFGLLQVILLFRKSVDIVMLLRLVVAG